MDVAQEEIADRGISIPTAAMSVGESAWNGNGNGPPSPRRRSSRSRSPGDSGRGGRDGGRRMDKVDNNPGNNLHVSGLSRRVDTRELEAAFAKIGRVQKASIMCDPHSRESRGFGFVTMETAEEAEAAITALNATDLMGKTMNVEKARRGRARTPTPGRYYGPPKRHDSERLYNPRAYDSRYARGDDRRGRYDDRDRGSDRDRGGGDRGGGRRDRYRGGGDYDRRDYDDRRDRGDERYEERRY